LYLSVPSVGVSLSCCFFNIKYVSSSILFLSDEGKDNHKEEIAAALQLQCEAEEKLLPTNSPVPIAEKKRKEEKKNGFFSETQQRKGKRDLKRRGKDQ
jgi:hypothetical protein